MHESVSRRGLVARAEGAQIRWLEWNGWKYAIRADGRVLVAREMFEQKMLDKPTKPKERVIEPDWDAMNR